MRGGVDHVDFFVPTMMGKRFSVEESDFDAILGTGKEEDQEE